MDHEIIQVLTGMLGSLGFAVLYNIRGKKLAVIALGGAFGWIIYLLCSRHGAGLYISLFAGTFFVSAFSGIMARVLRVPVLVLQIPMTIPMIPGSDLYYTAQSLVGRDFPAFGMHANRVLSEAFAMAVGIAAASYAVRTVVRIMQSLRKAEN